MKRMVLLSVAATGWSLLAAVPTPEFSFWYGDREVRGGTSVDGSTATVRRGNRTVRVNASAPVSLENGDRGDRIWSPVTGLLCAPLSVPLDKPVTLVLTCEGVVAPLGL